MTNLQTANMKNMNNDMEHSKERELAIDKAKELQLHSLDRSDLEILAATWYLRLIDANEFVRLAQIQAMQQYEFNKKLISDVKIVKATGKATGIVGMAHLIGKSRQKTISASNAGKTRAEKDPRHKEKAFVKECWMAWQDNPKTYKSKAAFARDILEKCKFLESNKVIEDWCRDWEKELKK